MWVLRCVQQSRGLRFQSSSSIAAVLPDTSTLAAVEPSTPSPNLLNSAALARSAAGLSVCPQPRKQQAVSARPDPPLGLPRGREPGGHINSAPHGSRRMSVKRKSRGGGGGLDSEAFEDWLRANPLPNVIDGGQLSERGVEGPILKQLQSPGHRVNGFADGPVEVRNLGLGGGLGLQQRREFSWEETGDVLYEVLCECDEMVWSSEQKRFLEVNASQGGWRVEFVPPLIQPALSARCTPKEYLQSLHQRRERGGNKQLVALLASNAAALGVVSDGKLLLHKVITAYTVRAKQGKSQLKYLRQGGPGRMTVGGAIRGRETDRFFTRVCEKLNEWSNEIQSCEVLFFSGTTRIWNEVYAADTSKLLTPRNDSRWCKVPYDVREPRLREVQRVFYRLSHGAVGYSCHHEQPPFQ